MAPGKLLCPAACSPPTLTLPKLGKLGLASTSGRAKGRNVAARWAPPSPSVPSPCCWCVQEEGEEGEEEEEEEEGEEDASSFSCTPSCCLPAPCSHKTSPQGRAKPLSQQGLMFSISSAFLGLVQGPLV